MKALQWRVEESELLITEDSSSIPFASSLMTDPTNGGRVNSVQRPYRRALYSGDKVALFPIDALHLVHNGQLSITRSVAVQLKAMQEAAGVNENLARLVGLTLIGGECYAVNLSGDKGSLYDVAWSASIRIDRAVTYSLLKDLAGVSSVHAKGKAIGGDGGGGVPNP